MRKKALVLAIGLATGSVSATEVYKSDKLNIDIGGNIQLMMFDQDGADTVVADNGSRIHVAFDSKLNEDITFRGFFGSYLSPLASSSISSYNLGSNSISMNDNGGDVLSNRQGYFAVDYKDYGEFAIGKKYSIYADITGVTDIFNVYSAMASGTYSYGDGGTVGTGRADQIIQWIGDLPLGNGHMLHYGLQGTFTSDTIELKDTTPEEEDMNVGELHANGGYNVGLLYKYEDLLKFGLTYVTSDIDGVTLTSSDENAVIKDPGGWAASIAISPSNWYAAAVITDSTELHQDDEGHPFDGNGYEVALSYKFGAWQPELGWNYVSTDDVRAGQYEMNYTMLTLNYNIEKLGFFAFIEGMVDNGTNYSGDDSDDNYVAMGMYYPF